MHRFEWFYFKNNSPFWSNRRLCPWNSQKKTKAKKIAKNTHRHAHNRRQSYQFFFNYWRWPRSNHTIAISVVLIVRRFFYLSYTHLLKKIYLRTRKKSNQNRFSTLTSKSENIHEKSEPNSATKIVVKSCDVSHTTESFFASFQQKKNT